MAAPQIKYPKVEALVRECRESPPTFPELSSEPTERERTEAYANTTERLTVLLTRIVDALDELRAPPTQVRVLWIALLSVISLSAAAIVALVLLLASYAR